MAENLSTTGTERALRGNTHLDPTSDVTTRDRILGAAESLFASRGFHATSAKDIAREAGVASGLIFYYFPTKEALLETIVEERHFVPMLQEALSTGDPVESLLINLGVSLFEAYRKRDKVVRILFREFRQNAQLTARFRELRDGALRLLAGRLDKAIEDGHLRRVDTMMLARVFVSTIALAAFFDDTPDPRGFVEELVKLMASGLSLEEAAGRE
jgi:AcrR family transcriptional regulator